MENKSWARFEQLKLQFAPVAWNFKVIFYNKKLFNILG